LELLGVIKEVEIISLWEQ